MFIEGEENNEEVVNDEAPAEESNVIDPDDNGDFEDEFDKLAAEMDGTEGDKEVFEPEGDKKDDPAPAADAAPEDDQGSEKKEEEKEPEKKDVEKSDKTDDTSNNKDAALQSRIDALEQENRSHRGRLSAKDIELNKLNEQIAASDQAASSAKETEDDDDGADPFEGIREDYSEIIKPLETVLGKERAKTADLQAKLDRLEGVSEKDAKLRDDNAMLAQQDLLTERNPNWEASSVNEKFQPWLETQPKYMRDIVARNAGGIKDHEEAFDVIAKFETDNGISYKPADEPSEEDKSKDTAKLADKREMQKKSAKSPTSNSRGASANGPADDGDQAFEFYAAKTDKANGIRP